MRDKREREARFGKLMAESQAILYRVALAYARSREDLEDLHQDMTVALWGAFPSWDESRPFSTWMYRVALNTALSWERRASRRLKPVGLPEGELAGEPRGDWELAETLRSLMKGLPALERALTLLYVEGRSYEEIGEVLGLNPASAAVKVSRIKERLRKSALAE